METVLTTYDTAVSGTTSSEHVPGGEMPLALLSTKYEYGKNNVLQYSYVMLIGSTEFASDSYLAYAGNRRVMLSSARVFTANRVAPDIQSKPFASTALTLETGTAQTLTWLICTVVPGAMLIIGVVVFFRRRHL